MTIEDENKKWEEMRRANLAERSESKSEFKTLSSSPVKPLYSPLDPDGIDYLRDVSFPGQFPFTWGPTPNGDRPFESPHDFYSGYVSSESANERYRDPVSYGATAISLALDLPTQIGRFEFSNRSPQGAHSQDNSSDERKRLDLQKTVLVVGGIIPTSDVNYLMSLGVDAVFGPGSDTRVIVKTITKAVYKKRGRDG